MQAVALVDAGVATTIPSMGLGGSASTVAYVRQTGGTRTLLARSPAWALPAPGPEEIVAQYEEPVPYLPLHWSQVAVAARNQTTLVVWARGGRPLVAFSRTAAPPATQPRR